MASKILFLVCNAHLDPVWLWEWEEGLAETLSTFRIAAHFCEEYDGFVFCHNESLLYQWIDSYEPELFERIKTLVKEKKWQIIGGWFLQPDCNIPSGESMVRQILTGKKYFKEKFNAEPSTGVNLDPFGHSRGLVQILKKSGYDSYIFCRPDKNFLDLPANDFIWEGYDGSKIMAHRAPDHYNSSAGEAGGKIKKWIKENKNSNFGILLWGIGNHGGGPSKTDLKRIEELMSEEKNWEISHARPEDYFKILEKNKDSLQIFSESLNPFAVGCYTSMMLVKQKHRLLENMYFSTEKMLANIVLQGLMEYPYEELHIALEDLLFTEFHDILPGSSISEVETYTLDRTGHALEILRRLRSKAFFKVISGYDAAGEGEFPIFIYNMHPYDIEEVIICEFQPQEPNLDRDIFLLPELKDHKGKKISYQLEKESCNIATDQRKRVVFKANLPASSMTRYFCYLKKATPPEKSFNNKNKTHFQFKTENFEVKISKKTGLVDRYKVNNKIFINKDSFGLVVFRDYADSWGMKVRKFRDIEGMFTLMSKKECALFAGLEIRELEPVRIIEEGPIRTVVEALFKYKNSTACVRYRIPKKGTEMEIEIRIYWMEKDRMLKLFIPTTIISGKCRGQVMYGVEEFKRNSEELIAQKWIGVNSPDRKYAMTIINSCTYGFDFEKGELGISLLRSPAYSGHPVDYQKTIILQDRFEQRMDQGERLYKFWIDAGSAGTRYSGVEREAEIKNEPPMALCCFPSGTGKKILPGVSLSDNVIRISSLKMAENKKWLIIRLYEPTGETRTTNVFIPVLNKKFKVKLNGFEIKSFAVDIRSKKIFEVDLLERKLN